MTYPTEARLLLAVQLDEIEDPTEPASAEALVEIAADALSWCQHYERKLARIAAAIETDGAPRDDTLAVSLIATILTETD